MATYFIETNSKFRGVVHRWDAWLVNPPGEIDINYGAETEGEVINLMVDHFRKSAKFNRGDVLIYQGYVVFIKE